MHNIIFFFIGTEAELIKIFPVILECKKRKMKYCIISSGQNDIINSRIFKEVDCGCVDLVLSNEKDIKKNALGLIRWFIKTLISAKAQLKRKFKDINWPRSYMVVHGDTVSTLMGAFVGKKLGMTVCHVEAGLRSHNLLNPFPEEIDRLLTSKIARFHYAPGQEPCKNLKKVKGKVVNTQLNTIIDSLQYSLSASMQSNILEKVEDTKYFVFVMHRQENLINKKFVSSVIHRICQCVSEDMKCVFILHAITQNALLKYDLMKQLNDNPYIILQPRMGYFDFMKLLEKSQYVITDGGSNQEELCYMGKPCLIMRKNTERTEGIGENAVLFGGEVDIILSFAKKYKEWKREKTSPQVSPSKIIVNSLCSYMGDGMKSDKQ